MTRNECKLLATYRHAFPTKEAAERAIVQIREAVTLGVDIGPLKTERSGFTAFEAKFNCQEFRASVVSQGDLEPPCLLIALRKIGLRLPQSFVQCSGSCLQQKED